MDSARAVVAQEGDLIERLLALAGQICAVGRVTVGQVGGVFTMGKLPMMGWITEERHTPFWLSSWIGTPSLPKSHVTVLRMVRRCCAA